MFVRSTIHAVALRVVIAALAIGSAPAVASQPEQTLSFVSGSAFLDANVNGVQDAGEGPAFGYFKLTNGGSYFSCGFTGKGGTFGVPVKTGTYYMMPVSVAGFHTTTPVVKVEVKAIGKSYPVKIGFARSPSALAEPCSQYLPKRIARPVGLGIIETAVSAGKFNTLLSAVERAGLTDVLLTGGPFTVFAPSDTAFAKLTDEELAAVLGNKAQLAALLRAHIVPGRISANDVLNGADLKTLNGSVLTAAVADDTASVNGAELTATDIIAANGVIHVIDSVIIP